MTLEGKPFAPKTPAAAVRAGLGLVPEERRTEGLLLTKSVAFNISLANLERDRCRRHAAASSAFASARSLAEATIRDLAIKAQSPDQPVGRLSGGNQQKVVIGRWLQSAPKC